ncbi:MAG TPA: MlaD family protein [Burkholderiales bacterium]|nr:MlaD family protein [Burkholderiales bacterium]
MQEEHARPRRFVGIGRKVSVFLLAAVFGVVGVILLVGYKQGVFVRHTRIYFHAADVFGISKGTSVRLFGLPVGSVSDLDISDRGVKVELSLISDYTPRIPKTTRARLVREGYVGAANIQLVPGGEPGRALQPVVDGDEIEYMPARGVAELVDEFKTQLTPVIDDLRRMLVDLNRPDSEFRKSIAGASALLQQLPDTNREARKMLKDTGSMARQAESTFASLGRVSGDLEREVPLLSGKLAGTLDSIAETSTQIRDATRKNGDALHEVLVQMPGLVRDSGELVRDGQDVVGAARNSWLLRDNIEVKSMRSLPVDSFESTGAGAKR